ncbi:MAG: hypothetical protein Q4G16_11330 [Cruoricaptor ignavus]|nr:hypothetical protein [Cruoricaptor ignavus]
MKEVTKNDVSFVNYTKLLNNETFTSKIDGGGVGFEFSLGRQSRNCNGFGVCQLTAFWVEIYKTSTPLKSDSKFTGVITKNKLFTESGKSSEVGYNAFLVLENKIDKSLFNTDFYIDKDINVDNKYIVKEGVYLLDETLGDYGGYKLDVIKL